MIATKQAMLAKQRLGDVECRVFVMDERAFNKEYTKYYQKAQDTHGVEYTRCRVSAIREDPETHDLILRYPDESGQLMEDRFGLVVLATGVEPPGHSAELARMMGIELNEYGFVRPTSSNPCRPVSRASTWREPSSRRRRSRRPCSTRPGPPVK
jgi:heterodisulfide reductase subunit A